jgi:hypothetical protein
VRRAPWIFHYERAPQRVRTAGGAVVQHTRSETFIAKSLLLSCAYHFLAYVPRDVVDAMSSITGREGSRSSVRSMEIASWYEGSPFSQTRQLDTTRNPQILQTGARTPSRDFHYSANFWNSLLGCSDSPADGDGFSYARVMLPNLYVVLGRVTMEPDHVSQQLYSSPG